MRLGFIGFGNMASALADGAVKAGILTGDNIIVSSPGVRNGTRSAVFRVANNNADAAEKSDVIVLGTKPDSIKQVCEDIADTLLKKEPKPLIVSIAAGVSTDTIRNYLRCETMPVARAMPNTPVSVGLGASGVYFNPFVTTEHIRQIRSIIEATGILVVVNEERDLDKITAISGSGPAYFLLMEEMLTSAAQTLGLDHDVATRLVAQTMLGTGVLVSKSNLGFEALRKKVTSKGGTTAAAVERFIDGGFQKLVENAVNAAYKRAVELGG